MKSDILTCHRYFDNPMTIPYKTHAHEMWEFLFVMNGNPICMVEGKRYAIPENTLLVFKPAQIHRVYVSGDRPYEYHSLMCEESLLNSEMMSRISVHGGIIKLKDGTGVNRVLSKIHRQNESVDQPPLTKNKLFWMEELLQAVSEDIEGESLSTVLSEDPVVMAAVRYIEENVQNITGVSEICDAVGVTKESLYNRFIQSMLLSPMKYVRAKRAALAKAAASEKKQAELLNRYGFADEVAFAREYEYFYKSVP